MKKVLLFLVVGFACGFFTHAIVFPDLFSNGIFILPQGPTNAQEATQSQQADTTVKDMIISYDGTKFSRTNVRMESSRYISISNDSQNTTMDLVSTDPDLSTPRPYGYKEVVRTRIDKPGQYVVADRNNPEIRMVITVK